MKIIRLTTVGVLVISALLMLITPALADGNVLATYGFCNITHNSATDEAIGEAQLYVEVVDTGVPGTVAFMFHNAGPEASSITDIYFDDGHLLGIATITNGPGTVDFSQLASPPDLPGGANLDPDFVTTEGFSADSNPPASTNGAGPGEYVTILFNLINNATTTDVVSDLQTGLLRIGIHVQAFSDGNSEAFVNCQRTAVTLASFTSRSAGSAVRLEWVTGTEINNAGFNIYRASSVDGGRTKVNQYLLAATGEGASGASYQYLDAPGYGTFVYWLEDVETTGAATLHGPVAVTIVSPIRRPAYRPVPAGQ